MKLTRSIAMLMTVALLAGAGAPGGWRSYVPSYPVSPIAPRSEEECRWLQQAFRELHAEVSQQHEDCLSSATGASPAGRTCTRAACQPLHDVRDGIPGLADQRVAGCRALVVAHMRDQRERFVQRQEREANEAARQARFEAEAAARAAERDSSAQRRLDAEAARQRATAAEAQARNAAATRAAHDQARKYFPNALPAPVPAPARQTASVSFPYAATQSASLAATVEPTQPRAASELAAERGDSGVSASGAGSGDWRLGKLDLSQIQPDTASTGKSDAVGRNVTAVTVKSARQIAAPEDPTSRAECEAFRDEARAAAEETEKAHDECLMSNSGGNDRAGAGADVCSKPACQALHSARRELSDLRSDGYSQCIRAVADFERNSTEGARSLASGSTMEQFRKAVMSGPLAALRGLATKQVASILSSTFGPESRAVVSGLQKGIATTMLVQRLGAVQSVCRSKGDQALRECNAAIALGVRELGQRVPARLRTDPAIAVIQQGVFARLRLELAATRRDIDRMGIAIEGAGKDDGDNGRR